MNPQNEQAPERLSQLISDLGDRLHRENEKLSAVVDNVDARITQLDQRFTQVAQDLTQLVSNVHGEMRQGLAPIDAIEIRVDRHGGMLEAGASWTTLMQAWSEKIDEALSQRNKRISELEERVRNLERKPNGHQ